VEVDNTALNAILDLRGSDSQLDIFISPSSCITNREGMILTAPDNTFVGTNISSLDTAMTRGTSTKTLLIKGTELSLNLIFDNGALRQHTDQLRNLVFMVTIAITGCFVIIVLLMTGRLQRRSNRIASAISSFRENQEDVDVVIDEHDEILYVIANQFNKMTSDITVMVSELRAKNEHIAAATDQRRKAEIRALQAQINPHFLYNALDRINWMAIDNEQGEISEMLVGLASLLRYSISNIDILVPLKAEIQWMEKYLFIQGKRFEREIEFVSSVYGDAIDFPIYKMLMQPLVENSVLHAFALRPNGNRIRLDAHILDDARLRLVLSDNGNGMDKETLAAIREQISAQRTLDRSAANADVHDEPGLAQDDEGGIGIHNVIERLWLYYGREGDIHVESVSGQGTSFVLIIPYRAHA
jgi:two-component system sensor histidine kinase YesM